MIGGVAKSYNLTIDYVLYELSYTNLIMYSAVLPSYNSDKKKPKGTKEEKKGMSVSQFMQEMKKIKQ